MDQKEVQREKILLQSLTKLLELCESALDKHDWGSDEVFSFMEKIEDQTIYCQHVKLAIEDGVEPCPFDEWKKKAAEFQVAAQAFRAEEKEIDSSDISEVQQQLNDSFSVGPKKVNNMVQVKFKKLTETAKVPEYKSAEAAGMDLCADEDVVLHPRRAGEHVGGTVFIDSEVHLVKTGIAIELPVGYEAQVRPRSGLAFKHGITVVNSPGTVDSDYRGDVGVILQNLGKEPFRIQKGDRIAQLVIAPVSRAEMIEVEELDESDRGAGGFGSTGK